MARNVKQTKDLAKGQPAKPVGLTDRAFAGFLTAEQASEYLGGLNSRTVTRWAREGYIPAIPVGEGKRRLWRFLEADLEGWMLARRQGGKNAA